MRNHYNEQPYIISPAKNSGEVEDSLNGDAKKSRNRHLVMINQLRRKEESWNGRFYLEHIPKYNPIQDEHCETYKKILMKKQSRKFLVKKETKGQTQLEFGGKKKSEDTTYESLYKRPESNDKPLVDIRVRAMYPNDVRPREKVRAESSKRQADGLLKEKKIQQDRLLATWDRLSIPMFHREAFLKCENLQNLKHTVEIIKKEIDDVETSCSTIQLAIKAVTARENCLRQLKALTQVFCEKADEITKGSAYEEELKQKAAELLTHLRILSLNVVDSILRWREYIQQTFASNRGPIKASQAFVPIFIYNQSNYLIKLKSDTKDLAETPLAQYFTLSTKFDPFLFEASKETGQQGKIVLPLSKSLGLRIKTCENALQNESATEHPYDKKWAPPIGNPPKAYESPSDRSLNHQDDHGKKTNIKIRNTSLTKPRKDGTGNSQLKSENVTKQTGSSNPSSQNQITDGDMDTKVADISEPRHEPHTNNEIAQQHSQPEITQEKLPENASSSQKEIKQEAVEVPKPEEKEEKDVSNPVQPVDLYEDEVEEYLRIYLQKIDQNMKDSFISDPKVLLERANMGQDPIWFELVEVSGAERKTGLAVAHIDNTVFTARRMVILHFTSEDREMYHDFLAKFVEYLWKNDECNEIKICLYHIEDQNGNLGADKNLEQAIKKLGFRWKQLTNDKHTGKRYIDYLIKRPENVVSSVAKSNDEPIHVESVVVLSDVQGEIATNKASKHIVDNRYAVLSAALKHCDEKLEKLGDSDTKRAKNYLQVIGSLAKEGQGKIGGLAEKFQSLQEMTKFVEEKFQDKKEFVPQLDAKFAQNIFTTSLLNLIYRWKSFNITHHKVDGKDRKYLKINNNGELVQFQSKYKSSSIYFIPTDDNEVNVFLTDNDAIINDILSREEIIEDVVSKLFSKLEKTPTSFQEDLWVPLFSIKENNVDLEDVKSLLQGEHKLNYAASTCQIGVNGSRVVGNLKVRPSEKSKIIEKPFLFGIVHEQVDFPLFSVVVRPEDFIQRDV